MPNGQKIEYKTKHRAINGITRLHNKLNWEISEEIGETKNSTFFYNPEESEDSKISYMIPAKEVHKTITFESIKNNWKSAKQFYRGYWLSIWILQWKRK
jgi:hypothetical protein